MSAGRVVIWLSSTAGKGFALPVVIAVGSAVGAVLSGVSFKAGQWFERKKKPWLRRNSNGEKPGDICCQRATGKYCHEHDPKSYE